MINLVNASFGMLVLGLNLMVIWVMLNTVATNTTASQTKLVATSIIVIGVGLLVIVIGILQRLTMPSPETGVILSTGSNVTSLGILLLVRIRGYGHERVVFTGSRVVVGIGIGLILIYILSYIL